MENVAQQIADILKEQQDDRRAAAERRQGDQAAGKADKKVDRLSEAAPMKWFDFKKHFLNACKMNRWSNARARLELADAVRGDVAAIVAGIPVGDEEIPAANGNPAVAVQPYMALVDAYQEAILPADSLELFRNEVRFYQQREEESVRSFGGRLRKGWEYAYPELWQNGVTPEGYLHVREQFLEGLSDSEVRRQVALQPYRTLTEAMTLADNATAALQKCRGLEGKGPLAKAGIHNINPGQGPSNRGQKRNGKGFGGSPNKRGRNQFPNRSRGPRDPDSCLNCGKKGHYAKDCKGTCSFPKCNRPNHARKDCRIAAQQEKLKALNQMGGTQGTDKDPKGAPGTAVHSMGPGPLVDNPKEIQEVKEEGEEGN